MLGEQPVAGSAGAAHPRHHRPGPAKGACEVAISYTYPGVYVQELQSPVHTITGVATSIAAFVGYTPSGIDNRAQAIFSFGDFERLFGGLASDSAVSYAVAQFYQNAPGQQAYVVRVPKAPKATGDAAAASVQFDGLTFASLSSGAWANGNLLIDVDQGPPVDLTVDQEAFNLTVTNLVDGTTESFPNVTLDTTKMNYVATVVNDVDNGSQLVKVSGTASTSPLPASGVVGSPITVADVNQAFGGSTTTTNASNTWGFQLTTSSPTASSVSANLPVTVTLLTSGSPIPQSLSGLALQLQQTINTALAGASVTGASVQCSVVSMVTDTATPPTLGTAIRINATLPNQPDAVLEFEAPSGPNAPQDARQGLGLESGTGTPLPVFNVAHYALGTGHGGADWGSQTESTAAGPDGDLPGASALIGDQASFTGMYALEKVDLFNLLCFPDATRALPSDPGTAALAITEITSIYSQAIPYCDQRRAFLLVDPPPDVATVSGAITWISTTLGITDPNGAAFWPQLRLADPLNNYNLRSFAPCGVVAGVYATTDGSRGLWKAPAGINATLNGAQSLTYTMTDQENGQLNPLGLNCFRSLPVYGRVLWGARTLQGADALASQWKYVPVRRMALFLEESLYRGLKWVVFEPNDAPLWAAIRLNVESFMQTLFLKGAFQGTTPTQAYFVKCDSETTTPADVSNGIVNILVGFAPLEPAEFVVIQIEQLTGQASS
jgi:phage tail sheath protein FI